MTDLRSSSQELPRARPLTAGRWSPSLVWLVPLVALVIGAWLALRAFADRGPSITITFDTAEGLEAGKTTIKYRSVDIGVVKTIALLDDRSGVVATAEMTRQAEKLLVEDAHFWVVRPRVSAAGISGIGTLINGAHIGFDAGASPRARRAFTGLESPPPLASDRAGRRFVLRGENLGSLDVGAPVYLRRLAVGQATRVALDGRGQGVVVEVFVDAPHDRHVTAGTRFWHASGVDLTVSARGIKLDTQSMASVLAGGIAFETPAPGAAAPAATEFVLFDDREGALRNPTAATDRYAVGFAHSIRGLSAGAPVEFLGHPVGEVTAIELQLDPDTAEARSLVRFALDRRRLGGEDPRALLDRLVARGLRAQLRSDNLLTGARYLALDLAARRDRARIDWAAQPPRLPALESSAEDLQASVSRILEKLEKLPLDRLASETTQAMGELRTMLQGASRLVARVDGQVAPQMMAVLGQAGKTLGAVEQTLSADSPLQGDLRRALRDLGGAAHALRTMAEYLERHPESLIRGKKEDRK